MSSTPSAGNTRISPWRAALLGALAIAVVGGAGWALLGGEDDEGVMADTSSSSTALFSGYVDVTATPSYAFESPVSASGNEVVLAFVVADAVDKCVPSWGAAYNLAEADTELDLERRLALLRVRGGDYTVSFGGAINDEIATVCTNSTDLLDAYRSVVERYDLDTVDYDLEGDDLADRAGNVRRAKAVAALQQERAEAGTPLAVWLTLPAATAGLTDEGIASVREFLEGGVELTGVNAMTMNFGGSRVEDQSMVAASEQTLERMHTQLASLFGEAGQARGGDELWASIGMTPMIGQNDVVEDVLTLKDAAKLTRYAKEKGIGRISAWSLNRDRNCGVNYIATSIVSDACSGVLQGDQKFADLFADLAAGEVAQVDPKAKPSAQPTTPADLVDDPATSPYPIWSNDVTYLAGTKVVWHRTVFMAKWWTTGDLPDDPGLTEFETPWRLLGPVLAGEKPLPEPTLAKGTYPQWEPAKVYTKGDRVLVGKTPYRAKWWNQGQSPEVAEANPDASAWGTFTATEVRQIKKKLATP